MVFSLLQAIPSAFCGLFPPNGERFARPFLTSRNNQGVQAIFAVTNFWEPLFSGASAEEARDKEVEQGTYKIIHSDSFPNGEQHGI